MHALAQANQLEAPYVIYAGQALRIPDQIAAELAPKAARRPSLRGPARRDAVGISERVDVSMVELAAFNQIDRTLRALCRSAAAVSRPGRRTAAVRGRPLGPISRRAAGPQRPGLPLAGQWQGGRRLRPIDQGQRRDGIDIAARQGAPVLAAEDGIVAYAGAGIRGHGRLILLRHSEGYITTYAHNAALLVEVGQLVERGQVIARVGSTGDAARSMLHFELRKGRKPIDPETILVREPTTVASTE